MIYWISDGHGGLMEVHLSFWRHPIRWLCETFALPPMVTANFKEREYQKRMQVSPSQKGEA